MAEEQKAQSTYLRMNLSGDPTSFEEGEMSFVLNGSFDDLPGTDPYVSSNFGTELAGKFPEGFFYNNKLRLSRTETLVFLVNPTTQDSQIGILDVDLLYRPMVHDSRLGFRLDHPIQAKFKTNYKGQRIVYFVDHLNPIRSCNIDSLPMLNGVLDIDQMLIFKNYGKARLRVDKVLNNGRATSGMYYFSSQYADAKGNGMTAWGDLVGGVPIFRDSLSSAYEHLTGSEPGVPTDKAIKIKIEKADLSFTHLNIGIIRVVNGVPSPYRVATIPVNQQEYNYTGAGNLEIPVTLEAFTAPPIVYSTAKTIEESDGSLLIGNLKGKVKYNFQKHFLSVAMQWVVRREKLNKFNFKNPVNTSKYMAFRQGEVYPIGMVIDFIDGTESEYIIFPGRKMDHNCFGQLMDNNVDPFGESVLLNHWDSMVISGNGDTDEDDTDLRRFRIYNTATVEGNHLVTSGNTEGPAEFGELAYWESTDRFPNDEEVWGDCAGQFIRHPKFPDSTVLHIHDGFLDNHGTGEYPYVNIMGLQFPNLEQIFNSLPDDIRSQIRGYRILRGDRTYNKSVIASGVIFNCLMQDFREGQDDFPDVRLVPNYPLNDIRPDPYIYDRTDINIGLGRPRILNDKYSRTSFTFISPDTSLDRALLTTGKLKIGAEVYGRSDGYHAFLDPYPDLDGGGRAGTPRSAVAAISVGWYNNYRKPTKGNHRRKLVEAMYAPGNSQVATGNIGSPLFNKGREACVLLAVSKVIDNPVRIDKTRAILKSETEIGDVAVEEQYRCDITKRIKRDTSAHYATIINEIPNQYGSVSEIKFVDTGYSQDDIRAGAAVFGGDTFVGTFAQKREQSFYSDTTDWVKTENGGEGMDFEATRHIPGMRYYYKNIGGNPRKESVMLCEAGGQLIGNAPDLGYIVMVYFGVPVIFTESDINMDLRLRGKTVETAHYPDLAGGSVLLHQWLNVTGIGIDNYFEHNGDYSYINNLKYYAPIDPLSKPSDPPPHYYGRTIRSLRSQPEDIYDNWQIFPPLDYYDFPKSVGELIDIRYIGNGRTLFRFERSIFEDRIHDSIETSSGKQVTLGSGRLFSTDPIERFTTDQGMCGTNSQFAFNLTEFGALMIDEANAKIYLYTDRPKDITELKAASWFWKYLPLQLPTQLPGIPKDNPFNPNGVGFITEFDPQTKVFLITKKDYSFIRPQDARSAEYRDGTIYVNGRPVSLSDPKMFANRSFTIAFSYKRQGWVTFMSFLPNAYLIHNNRLYSITDNFTGDLGNSTIHRHHVHNKIANYYGRQYPFIVEVVAKYDTVQEQISNTISFYTRAFRYHDETFFREVLNKTFEEVIIYNDYQHSGICKFKIEDENDLSSLYKVPVVTEATDSRTIPLKLVGGRWNFSDFYDIQNDMEVFSTNWNNADFIRDYPIDKVLIDSRVSYERHYTEAAPFRSPWIKVRFFYRNPSDIKLLLKIGMQNTRRSEE
jgi:hypothetical protein